MNETYEIERFWYLPVIGGAIGLVFGILVLARPETTLKTLAIIVGIYLILGGVLAMAHLFAHHDDHSVGPAWLVLGMLSLIAGLVVVRHPQESITLVAMTIGIWFVVAGALQLARAIIGPSHRLTSLIWAVVGIGAGTVILSSPDIGVKTLAIITGIALCLQGVAQLLEGFALRTIHIAEVEAGIAT